jgi:O-acetyl-ADP-ribose deacetylase (regulator of RNase III)
MIEFVTGNFFDYDADIRINTVNCVGVMGAGVALQFKNRFPEMYGAYSLACASNEVKPGFPYVWNDNGVFAKTTIINFPTKIDWKNPSEYEYIEKGLIWLRQYLLNKEDSTVTVPALGCGHGGLDWNVVKGMIVKYLGDIRARILVFEPSSSTESAENINEEELIEKGIKKILPSDRNYPVKLLGRSAREIFYKGNYELAKNKNLAIIVNSKPSEREKVTMKKLLDEFPKNEFTFLLGSNSSYEIDILKEIISRGFKAIVTLPCGILNFRIRSDLKQIWDYNNILVISISSPDKGWKSYESNNSFKFRMKLANATLINSIEYERFPNLEKEVNLSENKIFYVNYWKDKIDFFNRLSARKIGINPSTRKANIKPIIDGLNQV